MRKLISFIIVCCLLSTCVVPCLAEGPSTLTDQQLSKPAILLPDGIEAKDEQLVQVRGKGVVTTVGSFVAGGIGGFTYYVGDYLWDRYIARKQRSWSWSVAGKTSLATASATAMTTVVCGWWTP